MLHFLCRSFSHIHQLTEQHRLQETELCNSDTHFLQISQPLGHSRCLQLQSIRQNQHPKISLIWRYHPQPQGWVKARCATVLHSPCLPTCQLGLKRREPATKTRNRESGARYYTSSFVRCPGGNKCSSKKFLKQKTIITCM